MTRQERSQLHQLYVQLKDLETLNRGYQEDADGQGMIRKSAKFEGAAIAYKFAAGRINDIFLGKGEGDE